MIRTENGFKRQNEEENIEFRIPYIKVVALCSRQMLKLKISFGCYFTCSDHQESPSRQFELVAPSPADNSSPKIKKKVERFFIKCHSNEYEATLFNKQLFMRNKFSFAPTLKILPIFGKYRQYFVACAFTHIDPIQNDEGEFHVKIDSSRFW